MDGYEVLVDTSVWVDHLRHGDDELSRLLHSSRVRIHPFVIGELACGNLHHREEVLALLQDLPRLPVASHDEVLFYIGRHQLMGRGIGYIDAHLLASVALAGPARLWTRDKRLALTAESLELAYTQTTPGDEIVR
jgi:predicted nucleic acid-binding protein